ncbi:unnamed protein product [Peronospora belbahrii]|uniref:Uncharacterized protein n=1 Tax=Peronospora belbahrii TaxID=622444 RepID=A0AAU9KR19_9STRA|nr:unnamed protein product [Peronospora belbahrii]
MSKRDYFLQKGLQMQRLDEQISFAPTGSTSSREVTKYRELCPPGTQDTQIQRMIGQCKSDAQRMENAISELWEDYRGHEQDEAWATVSKRNIKKKQDYSSQRSYSSQKTQQQDKHTDAPQDGDAHTLRSSERFSTRGRGSMRGRGTTSLRGGRGGRGGRGHSGSVVATSSTRANRGGDKEEDRPENDDAIFDDAGPSNKSRIQQSSKVAKDLKRDRGAKSTTTKTTTSQPVVQAPPVVHPVLTGAWTKKLNRSLSRRGVPVTPATENDATTVISTSEDSQSVSPKKKSQQERKKKSKETQKFSTRETVGVVEKIEIVEATEKKASPHASPKNTTQKKKTKTAEPIVERSASKGSAGWGNLDVSSSSIDTWSSTAPADAIEPTKVSTPNVWARDSPVLSPPASKRNTSPPKSPIVDARTINAPESPRDIDVTRSSGSASSPRPYLKMGKWDSAATPNLSLQFGSFSLSGMDSLEPASPCGWASAVTTTAASNSNSGGQGVAKSTSTQSAWGTTTASPKKTLSPGRDERQCVQEESVSKATASAPPGLSVDSGRETPTTVQSPPYAPSAPSPASLPKPGEVKRGTPTRVQGGPFQAQSGAAAQKMNIGYGTGLYQSSYGQYSIDLGRAAATPTPSQLVAGSGTPKSAGARGGVGAQVASQSPLRSQQPVTQMQQIPLQQQSQQQGIRSSSKHNRNSSNKSYHYAPPPPPGMAMPYNPYNYAGYYQGYGYYQNPQFAQYSPRTQYPPRGSVPYGVDGSVAGFSNPPSMPYQDQHMMSQQHEYAGTVPQGFGEINAAYMQQPSMQQQGGHQHHGHPSGPQNHGKGGSASAAGGSGAQHPHGQRSNAGMQSYQNAGGRDHASPPVPNASAAMTGLYGQHYGWTGSYGAQPVGGWGHMMPHGYQQSSSQQQQQQVPQQQQQQPNAHQQSYHQYGNSSAQGGNTVNDVNQARWISS